MRFFLLDTKNRQFVESCFVNFQKYYQLVLVQVLLGSFVVFVFGDNTLIPCLWVNTFCVRSLVHCTSLVSTQQTLLLFFHPTYTSLVKWLSYISLWVAIYHLHYQLQLYWLYINFFLVTFILFISIASKFSEHHFVVWLFGSNTKWFLLLSVVRCLMFQNFLTFLIVFLKTELLISSKKSFSKYYFAQNQCLASARLPDWTQLRFEHFFSFNQWFKAWLGLLFVWHMFLCCANYTQVSHIFQSSFLQAKRLDHGVPCVAS